MQHDHAYDHQLRFSESIRCMIDHETAIAAQRFNWILVVQAFLFQAAGSLQSHPVLIGVLAVLGIGTSVSMRREILFSYRATGQILQRWNQFKEACAPDQLAAMPPAWAGGKETKDTWMDYHWAADFLLPILFSIAWVVLFVVLVGEKFAH